MTAKNHNLLTQAGFDKLKQEQEELLRVVRPRVVKGIADAAAEGDRSENAEYIYGKKHLREIDKRLAYLHRLLVNARPVSIESLNGTTVCFGATVVVCDEDDIEKRFTIVGDGEADYKNSTVSCLSPVGRALLGHKVGDCVEIELPAKHVEYEIKALYFGAKLIAKASY